MELVPLSQMLFGPNDQNGAVYWAKTSDLHARGSDTASDGELAGDGENGYASVAGVFTKANGSSHANGHANGHS